MKYQRSEAVRYMGAKKGDPTAELLADQAYLQLRNEVRPKSCWQMFDCRVEDGSVILPESGMRFDSANLARHLQGCAKIAVMAATLGSSADSALRRLALTNMAQAAAGQAVCAALIESYCDQVQAEVMEAVGLNSKNRFSPGYGDWQLQDQSKLLALLDCGKKIGLTLTDGYMLSPVKSVTAVIGLTAEQTCKAVKCRDCINTECEFREE